MKINPGSHFPAVHRQNTHAAAALEPDTAFATTLSAARTSEVQNASDGIRRMDFTDMTRQDLREWVNAQIRSGRMTLDESTPFVGMTIAIPVNGDFAAAERAMREERVDFMAAARLGIAGAYWRQDHDAATRLESALGIMLRHQGSAAGIDIRA